MQAAEGTVNGYAQYIGHDGKAISSGGAPTIGLSFDPNQAISPLHLVQGRPPTTARRRGHGPGHGAEVRVLGGQTGSGSCCRGPTRTFTITGIAKFGTANNLAGATLAAFDMPTAQALLGEVGQFDAINVVTTPGADKAAVQRAIAAALPHGVEVVTGQTVVNEQTSTISSALGFFNTALLVFGFIALFVGGVHDPEHVLDHRGAAHEGAGAAAHRRARAGGRSSVSVLTRGGDRRARLVARSASGLGVLAALGLEALLSGFGVTLPSGRSPSRRAR